MKIEDIFQELGRMHLEISELRAQKMALEAELASVRKTDEPPKPEPT